MTLWRIQQHGFASCARHHFTPSTRIRTGKRMLKFWCSTATDEHSVHHTESPASLQVTCVARQRAEETQLTAPLASAARPRSMLGAIRLAHTHRHLFADLIHLVHLAETRVCFCQSKRPHTPQAQHKGRGLAPTPSPRADASAFRPSHCATLII